MVSNRIQIRKAHESDSIIIAQLHIENIKAGFLTSLGKKLLTGIYSIIITGKESFCFVAESNGKIVAFLSATQDCNQLYRRFFRKNFFWGLKIIIMKVVNWQVLKKTVDHLFLPRRKVKLPASEFLTIAVDRSVKRLGVGTQLFRIMQKEFRKRKIEGFIAIVGQSLVPSNKFMHKMKGTKISEFEVHKGEKSNVYFWD